VVIEVFVGVWGGEIKVGGFEFTWVVGLGYVLDGVRRGGR